MKFTQAQVRELAGIGEETFRTWRSAFPALSKKGHAAVFSLGDVIAVCVIKDVVAAFRVKVSALSKVAAALFETCDKVSDAPADMVSRFLVMTAAEVSVVSASRVAAAVGSEAIVVSLRPMLERIRAKLLTEGFHQELLPFAAAR